MGGLLGGLAGWARNIVESMGYLGIALLVALENVFPPIPSELILPLAGFLVHEGDFNYLLALAAATAGSVGGALALYGLGRWLGEDHVRQFVRKRGAFLLVGEDDLDRARDWFERHGSGTVFFCRLVPGLRSLISLPAGVERMSLSRFVAWSTAGSGIWNAALIGAGWWLGSQWESLSRYMEIIQYGLLGLIAAAIGWFVWRRTRARGS
jgi:membrane protein DedA with SNARE-associated domain